MAADIKKLSDLYAAISKGAETAEKVAEKCHQAGDVAKIAKAFGEEGCAALEALRTSVDTAEVLVADEFWPMAKYQEILTVL